MAFRIGLMGTIDHAAFVTDLGVGSGRIEDVELAGVYEPDPVRGQALAQRWSIPWFDSKAALLDAGLAAVGIFTPFDEKAADIAACIERDIHVLADKPLAVDTEQAARLRTLTAAHPRACLTMALSLRIEQPYVRVRELVRSGAIGRPAVIHMRRAYRLKRRERPAFMFDAARSGGLWVELAVHDIDYLRWLTGDEVTQVAATHGNVSHPGESFQDHAAGLFLLDGGTSALIEQNRLVPVGGPGSDNRLSVVGSEGTIEMAGDGVVLWRGDKAPQPVPVGATDWSRLLANFTAAAQGAEPLLAPTADVLRATDISLAAYASAKAGGQVVTIKEQA